MHVCSSVALFFSFVVVVLMLSLVVCLLFVVVSLLFVLLLRNFGDFCFAVLSLFRYFCFAVLGVCALRLCSCRRWHCSTGAGWADPVPHGYYCHYRLLVSVFFVVLFLDYFFVVL